MGIWYLQNIFFDEFMDSPMIKLVIFWDKIQ
jgi:hypothetical protein